MANILNQSHKPLATTRFVEYLKFSELPAAQHAIEKSLRENTLRMKHGTYDEFEDDGLIAPGTGVRGEDIVIKKTAPISPDSEELGQRTRRR
ncbi:DNA-dependent RNA polymerase II [Marasmius sp. AFHP31]|nr:DNA-dependent RNA polymerase II [Marasmius sp. AFHP31]